MSPLKFSNEAFEIVSANSRKFLSFATKSVSQLTSNIFATFLSLTTNFITPSAATLEDFLSAFACPAFLIVSIALFMSPPASTSAFLHSIIPAPVLSRSSFTICAVILLIYYL